jgi:hypothetical protein
MYPTRNSFSGKYIRTRITATSPAPAPVETVELLDKLTESGDGRISCGPPLVATAFIVVIFQISANICHLQSK